MAWKGDFDGLTVHAPFPLWEAQLQVVKATLDAVRKPANALIDAPTGTGKTLALLTAVSAWIHSPPDAPVVPPPAVPVIIASPSLPSLDDADFALPALKRSRSVPAAVAPLKIQLPALPKLHDNQCVARRVIYLTRTHAQIAQVIGEARKLIGLYSPPIRVAVLAARHHLCGNTRVNKSPSLNQLCRRMQKYPPPCPLLERVPVLASILETNDHGMGPLLDVEQLAQLGQHSNACAFYTARHEAARAHIVVCPYNYVLDEAVRRGAGVSVTASDVVLFDEGHNVTDVARSTASLREVLPALQLLLLDLKCMADFPQTIAFIEALCQWLPKAAEGMTPEDFTAERNSWRGPALNELLRQHLHVMSHTWPAIREELAHDNEGVLDALHEGGADLLATIGSVFGLMLSSPSSYEHFAIVVKVTKQRQPELAVLCLWPGIALREQVRSARCVILASGSLAPFDALVGELGLQFPVCIQVPHVVPLSHLFFGVLGAGADGQSLDLSFKNAESLATQDELGNVLLSLARVTPNGMLCFFPSYGLLRKLISRWECTQVMNGVRAAKQVFVEVVDTKSFDTDLGEFYIASQGKLGALFFAVCRGKLSEGVNCTDWRARLVVVVGVPFPAVQDEAILLKRAYNDARAGRGGMVSGTTWYVAQAMGAAAQAVGRVVRHSHDWGAVVLLDPRFKEGRLTGQFPVWLRAASSVIPAAPKLVQQLTSFFARNASLCPVPPLPQHLATPIRAAKFDVEGKALFPMMPSTRPAQNVVLWPKARSMSDAKDRKHHS